MFRQLHVNDGAQSIPPFWMTLSLQIKPSSYLAMLKQAAAVGQSISDFVDVSAEEMPEEGYGEYYQDGDEDPTLLGDASGIENEGEVQAHDHQPHAEPELDEANHHEYDTSYENTEGGQEPHDESDHYAHYDETQQAEHQAQQTEEQTQQAADEAQQAQFEVYEDNEGQSADDAAEHAGEASGEQQAEGAEDRPFVVADDVPVDPTHDVEPSAAVPVNDAAENTTGEAVDGEEEDQEPEDTSNVESAASSTTIPAEQANDAVGDYSEYKDEDLIDWNESTLTSRLPDYDAAETDDFSTFLAENNVEESANVEDANKGTEQNAESDVNTKAATGGEDDHTDGGHDDTVDTTDIDFEVDDTEYHTEQADQDAPAEAADVVANGDAQEQPEIQASANGVADTSSEPRVAAETHSLSEAPTRNDEDYIDFDEDGIDFDDDTYEEHEARKASEANTPDSKSPSGKRPLSEAGDTEQPELKKVKSS